MPKKGIIPDTSCLIILSKINELSLLKELYKEVIITPEIAKEYGREIHPWFKMKSLKDRKKQTILELNIDKGEASAIALALEIPNSLLILDDMKARKMAEKLNLPFTGTLGVILRAKKEGIISQVGDLLKKINKTNFRISREMETILLKLANE